jgi:hypothetical protein
MPTLVLAPRQNDDARRMAAAAQDSGWAVYAAPSWRTLPDSLRDSDPVLYSDPLFADIAAGLLNLSLLEPTADWLTTVPERYLRRAVSFMTLEDARRLTGPVFLKPAEDKSFPARVYETPKSGLPPPDALPPEMPVLMSEPVIWEGEYRCFVHERCIAASSVYFRFGELAQDAEGTWHVRDGEWHEAVRFLETVLADSAVNLPPAAVVDVGCIAGRGWAVIEANPAWASGIYGCAARMVLPVLRAACRSANEVTSADRCWVRARRSIEG